MATSTISNTIEDPSGGDVEGILVTVTLMPTGGFRISDSVEVGRTVSTTTDTNGAWSLALERNSNISPANTHYLVTEHIPESQGGRRNWRIQVGDSNQTVFAALVTPLPDVSASNFLTQASADARYQALASIGADTPSTIDPDDSASAGVSTSASRGDHQHAIAAAVPIAVPGTGSLAEGVSTSFARADHAHIFTNAAWTDWTPTVSQNAALTFSIQYAKYIKVGRLVVLKAALTYTSGTAGAGTSVNIGGFPFQIASGAELPPLGTARILDASATDVFTGIWTATSATASSIYSTRANGFLGVVSFTAALTTSDRIFLDGVYEATS